MRVGAVYFHYGNSALNWMGLDQGEMSAPGNGQTIQYVRGDGSFFQLRPSIASQASIDSNAGRLVDRLQAGQRLAQPSLGKGVVRSARHRDEDLGSAASIKAEALRWTAGTWIITGQR
jgi:hypothetical protein